jgi:hypothetical protein
MTAERLLSDRCPTFLAEYSVEIQALLEFLTYVKKVDNEHMNSHPVVITLQFKHGRSFLFHPNAFFGMKKGFNIKRFCVRENAALKCKSYEQRYVGVGYKDKGNKKDPTVDGTPGWKEVAASNCIPNSVSLRGEPKLRYSNNVRRKYAR